MSSDEFLALILDDLRPIANENIEYALKVFLSDSLSEIPVNAIVTGVSTYLTNIPKEQVEAIIYETGLSKEELLDIAENFTQKDIDKKTYEELEEEILTAYDNLIENIKKFDFNDSKEGLI